MVRVADDDNRGPNPMQRWKIGAVTVTSVIEYEVPLPPDGFLPGATPELVAAHTWLRPDFADEQGQLLLRIQALDYAGNAGAWATVGQIAVTK